MGAGIADITTSYRRLCRIYHPDISDDPEAEELMKNINMAYSVLREKLRREAAFHQRLQYSRQIRRYQTIEPRMQTADMRRSSKDAEKEATAVLQGYFIAIKAFDFSGAYQYLSSFDKRKITRENFIKWRKSVARLFPMQGFTIGSGSHEAMIPQYDGKPVRSRKFSVVVTEEDVANDTTRTSDVEKYVVYEDGGWKVFLGYKSLGELTSAFDRQFEAGRRREASKRWEEYIAGLYPEYDMLSIAGMRKAASRELYRQGRFGGTMTLAAISVKAGEIRGEGQEHLLHSAAKTICGALRETDIPAYAGDGVFVLLLVELRKKNAEEIITRLIEKIRKNAGPQLGIKAKIEYAFESWSGQNTANISAFNDVLKKFGKRM